MPATPPGSSGSTRGIGLAIASELADHGAATVISGLGDREEILVRCHDMSNGRAIAVPAPSRSFASPASPMR